MAGILFDAPTATFHQDNAYTDFPLHGLWKIADDRVMSSNLFLSAKYAYYNTGNALTPMANMNLQAGRSLTTGQSFGSFSESISQRPQQTASVSAHSFVKAVGVTHDLEFGSGYRTTDSTMLTEVAGKRHSRHRELADRLPGAGVPAGQRRQSRQLLRLPHRRHDLEGPGDDQRRPALRPSVGPFGIFDASFFASSGKFGCR